MRSVKPRWSVQPLAKLVFNYAVLSNHALPVIGDMELGNVSGSDIEEIYNAMREKGRKQNTIYGMYAALRSFFTYAVEINAITENPMDSVKPISQDLTI